MEHLTFDQLPAQVARLATETCEVKRLLQQLLHGSQPDTYTDELLTVHQAAEFLHLAPPTIYSMVQRKELPVSKRAGRLYFSKAELIEYVKAGRKKTAAEIETDAAAYIVSKKKRV